MIKHKGKEHPMYPGYFVIPEFKNYLVSEYGKVITLIETKTLKIGNILPYTISTRSPFYKRVTLYNNQGKSKVIAIHIIVSRAFLGNPPVNKPLVIYKDNDLNNFHWSNLKYTDSSEVARARDIRAGATQFRIYTNRI